MPFLSPRDLPNPGIKPGIPELQADSLSSEPHRWVYQIPKTSLPPTAPEEGRMTCQRSQKWSPLHSPAACDSVGFSRVYSERPEPKTEVPLVSESVPGLRSDGAPTPLPTWCRHLFSSLL